MTSKEISDIPKAGFLHKAWEAEQVMKRRRRQALELIQTHGSKLTSLLLFLENQDAIKSKRKTNYDAITDKIVNEFKFEPNKNQKQALSIALNTPDIALIQGPPGTGKTAVIRMIISRHLELLEKEKKHKDIKILLTSHQHEAVDNIYSDVITQIPIERIGGKRDDSRIKVDIVWINGLQKKLEDHIEENFTDFSKARKLEEIQNKIHKLEESVINAESVINILEDINDNYPELLSPELRLKLVKVINSQRTRLFSKEPLLNERDRASKLIIKTINDNKHIIESSNEGRKAIIAKVKRQLRLLLGIDNIPKEIANMELDFDHEEELKQAIDVFDNYITQFCDYQETNNTSDQDYDIKEYKELIECIITCVSKVVASENNGIPAIINDFVNDLYDYEQVNQMIKRYGDIIAATCQQSDNYDLSDANSFDLVIIDEAAYANPLDILIPMSKGRSIILVGDHKQLPHMNERDVVKKIRDQEIKAGRDGDEIAKLLEMSLFERLYDFLKSSESGITRTIMLTTDYRMHPQISNFVSNAFYDGEIEPGCNSQDRMHNLQLFNNKPLAWIDLPLEMGEETKEYNSFKRSCEVDKIHEIVKKIIKMNIDYKIGIITFYSGQEESLKKVKNELSQDDEKRLFIGTVDAFQGREFDVVILSTVRCNRRGEIGFLSKMNRLCVAFSRAKRLFILVGDSKTLTARRKEDHLTNLSTEVFSNYLSLCKDEGYYES